MFSESAENLSTLHSNVYRAASRKEFMQTEYYKLCAWLPDALSSDATVGMSAEVSDGDVVIETPAGKVRSLLLFCDANNGARRGVVTFLAKHPWDEARPPVAIFAIEIDKNAQIWSGVGEGRRPWGQNGRSDWFVDEAFQLAFNIDVRLAAYHSQVIQEAAG